MNEIKSTKGITLVTLVITIVVLLILAGISLYTLVDPNGIVSKGLSSKELTEIASEKEALDTSVIQLIVSKKNAMLEENEEDRKKLQKNLEDYTKSKNIEVALAVDEGYIFKVTFQDSKRVYYVDSEGNIIDELTPRYTVCFYLENLDDSNYTLVKTKAYEISDEVGKTIQLQNFGEENAITGGIFEKAKVDDIEVTEFTEEKGKKVNLYYKRISCNLTLLAGNNISSVQGGGDYKYGETVTISALLETAYGYSVSFEKWQSDNGVFSTNQTINIEMPPRDITLTAIASKVANTYTITYNGNGSTGGSMASSIHTYGTAKNLTANGFTKTGYTFKEWNTKADGSGNKYLDKQSVSNLASGQDDNVNLYAQWEDTIPPTVSPITVSDIQTTSITASLTAQDTGSGTVKVVWSYKSSESSEESFTIASTDTWEATTSSVTKSATITGLTANTSYTIQAVVYDALGLTTTKIATVETIEEPRGTTVEELISQNAFTVGDYVGYSVGNGTGTSSGSYTVPATLSGHTSDQTFEVTSYTGNWQILYTGSEGYGAQIISSQSVIGSFSWGTGTYSQSGLYIKGNTGYANLVETLNTLSGYYINANYASSARSLGSSPSDIQTSVGNTDIYSGSDSNIPTDIYADDTNYTMDEAQLNKKEKLKQAPGAVWLASRSITNQTTDNPYDYWKTIYGNNWADYYGNYGARIIYGYGYSFGTNTYSYSYLYPTPLVFLENTTYAQTPYTFAAGVRPCITLNLDLRLEKTTDSSGNTFWEIVE